MAYSSITGVTNATFWDLARKASPTFKSHTAKATAELFSEKGFESITRAGLDVVNEFFELSLRVGFQMINVSRAKNPLEGTGLVAVYDTPNGGFVQRIATKSVKPVSPAYKNLENGDSVDPYILRKPETDERFFSMNFDFQSFISIQEFQVKQIFISEYGMGEYVAGILAGLENGYIVQEYENTMEALNSALNSTNSPLQDTQKFVLPSWTDGAPTETELKGLLKAVKNIVSQMKASPQTSAYNAGKFASSVDPSDYVLLLRTGVKTALDVETMAGTFNPEFLTLPFESTEVSDFGGLRPYVLGDNDAKAYLQPIYNSLGEQVAYVSADVTVNGTATYTGGRWVVNVTSGSTTADTNDTYVEADLDGWEDPNENVIAVLAQKGVIFENAQNPYTVTPIYNPRGLYNNYWCNRPNTGINYDSYFNLITFAKPTE